MIEINFCFLVSTHSNDNMFDDAREVIETLDPGIYVSWLERKKIQETWLKNFQSKSGQKFWQNLEDPLGSIRVH